MYTNNNLLMNTTYSRNVLAKLLYAAPTWWGLANCDDMNRLEAFLWRADKSDYYTGDFTITALCEQAEQLFWALKYNPIHPLASSPTVWAQHTLPHPFQST